MISLTGLSSAALLGWASLGLTVLSVLYLLKLRRRRIAVPYLPLWQKVLKQAESESLFQRFRKLLSWLLQLLFWGLLLLALGNPRIRAEILGGKHTVLIVDTSASMKTLEGKRSRLALAKDRAARIIGALRGRDRLMLVSMSRDVTPRSAFSSNKKSLLKQLKRLRPDDTPASLRAALSLAKDALQGIKDHRVLVLSDGAFGPSDADLFRPPVSRKPPARRASVMPRPTVRTRKRPISPRARPRTARRRKWRGRNRVRRAPPPLPSGVKKRLASRWKAATTIRRKFPAFQLLRVGEATQNVGIVAFNARRRMDNPLQFSAYVKILNAGRAQAAGTLEILVDELVVQVLTFQVAAGSQWSRTLPRITARGERLKARIKCKRGVDSFLADNEAYAVLPKARPLSVLLVSNDNLYLTAALLASSGIRFEKIRCKQPPPSRRVFDVIVYNNCGPAVRPTQGRYLFFNPTSGEVPFALDTRSKKRLKAPIVTESNGAHPVMRFVALKDLNIRQGLPLKKRPRKGEKTLASTFGKPLILARDDKGLRAVLVGFALRESDFPLRVGFPLFVRSTLDWLMRGGRPLPPTTRVTGKRWTLFVPRRLQEVRIVGPSLKSTVVPVVKGVAHFSGTRAGFYRVRGQNFERWLAANLSNLHESNIQPTARTPKQTVRSVSPRDDSTTLRLFGFQVPLPRPLWLWLLGCVVALLVVEWLTYNRRVTV